MLLIKPVLEEEDEKEEKKEETFFYKPAETHKATELATRSLCLALVADATTRSRCLLALRDWERPRASPQTVCLSAKVAGSSRTCWSGILLCIESWAGSPRKHV